MLSRFRHWFVNVYWYHYKIHTLVTVVLIAATVFSVRSVVNQKNPDMQFVLASELPLSTEQGEALEAFFMERVESENGILSGVMNLGGTSDYTIAQWQVFTITLIDERYALYIIAESLTPSFEEHLAGFYTAEEMGLVSSDIGAQYVSLAGNAVLEELYLNREPMYAMVKRPRTEKDGTVTPENRALCQMAIDCLTALVRG